MIKFKLIIICVICSGLFFISCGDSGGGPQSSTSMFALVGSSNWRTPHPNAIISDNTIDVWGSSSNGQSIHISIKSGEKGEFQLGYLQPHEAKFTPNMSPGAVGYSTAVSEQGTGMVRVTSINEEARTLSGTFYFTAYRESDGSFRKVADGQFNSVPYRFVHNTDTATNISKFSFQDGGNQWEASEIYAVKNDTALIINAEISDAWESVQMVFPPDIAAGVHYITETGPIFADFQKGFYTYPASNGSTTISQHSQSEQLIKGTFFFNYEDENESSNSVTGGQYEVYYEIEEE